MKMGGSEKSKGNKKFQKSYFDVLGLCCSSEVSLIEKILKPLEGVKDVSVIVPSKTVIVVHDNLLISELHIAKALNQARLEANVRVYGKTNYQKKWPSPYAMACGVLLLLSFLKYFCRPFQWLAVGAVVIGICPIFLKGLAAIRNFTLDTNILALIAVMGSIALHDYWEAGSVVFLFTIAQWLESRASHKASAVMSSLMNIVPQKAVIAETGEEVDADGVEVNTILAIKAGEIIPIDGIVVDGKCEVDEKTLTGESFPVSKQHESTVWAGTINLNGYVSVRTTALAEECVVARMAKLVEEAQNNKSKTQRFIDKCAKFYTPAVVAISAGLAVVPAILRLQNQNEWFHLALVVLVSACPCALILSTPVATFCALSKAATSGLLIKGGEYLETLSKIKIITFDKTGTITRGEFLVTKFQSVSDDVSLNTLLYWVSSIESKSSHPMAAALIDYGRSHSVEPMSEKVEEFENFPGEGIHGKIDGKDVYVGNLKMALRAGCSTVPRLEGDTDGKSIGYIFLGGSLAGIFSLSDVCRTGAKEAIKELKSMGIKTAMLTGDSHEAAIVAQNQLEGALEVVHSELLPQDKSRIIKQFQKEAPTAMVGDGLNDAPALAAADIGISMGISGSALATETGNVILMSNDIQKIPKIIRLARRTRRTIIMNVILSILTKAAILALAFAGHPLVWAAVLADVGTCLAVIFNSMLLLRGRQKHIVTKKCCKSSHNRTQTTSKPPSCCSQKHAPSHQSGPYSSSNTCDNKTSSNSTNVHGCCTHRDQEKEAKHSDQENHLSHSSFEISQNTTTTNGHCHLNHCNHNHVVENHVVDTEHGHFDSNHGGDNCSDIHAPPIDISTGNEHMGCEATTKTCFNLEKRQIGGCCNSFRKECCCKNGHFGATTFGGELTKIIIE
ncbi:putative inactive cadmium/zinc-transporting ATPase HMA3 [Camellia sinensis]|uniref:putative inactive cadmium/zinc-transporting ATPase HMA3 n=1 Tax=Camellia sinensis TaxID=4442 RepID=UPI001035BC07|nr:putative inactive cadmium/zinc-transporting ATPase HMA3 [Camellia sinensis]XP_028114675.1 putative inactive cadmium/zinc-transporting ATPase HMA3 [Camellia sinensis]XP_028114681.1 putative inactive cadmium/zinc-transporting ATPase HMA3 [Camellia sinensis]